MESISTILFTGFCICLIHLLIGGFFIATCSYSGIFPMITIYLILLCWYSLQLRIHQYIKLIPNFAANFLVRVWYLPSDNNLNPLHPVWIENSSLLSCQPGCRNCCFHLICPTIAFRKEHCQGQSEATGQWINVTEMDNSCSLWKLGGLSIYCCRTIYDHYIATW